MPARLGQHFLVNPRPIKAAIAALSPERGDVIVEIGPGRGVLTFPLFKTAARAGARLILIERDPLLVSRLKNELERQGVKVIRGDAIEELPNLVRQFARSKTPYKVIGNIPYYITGALLRILSEAPNPPERTVLMVQREVAERLRAAAPKFNLLAAAVQFWAEPEVLAFVPRGDFSPPPKVDAALILLVRRPSLFGKNEGRERYYKTMRHLFRQPRKTLLNNIRAATGASREETEALLRRLGLPENARPHDLTVENIVRIVRAFKVY